ncbi:LIM/homeobox protein Lhx3 [Pleurostoma richardsiae]|uniref:LIM/homeobox protein Lhx3 n=1 Tax=Pleurostoma richardsiae TaxID=41990 RepID=A0AA38S6X7_9PEZI|nr:LIM/homeobox protein Lhx3 [Pleurostoma richardsiae]
MDYMEMLRNGYPPNYHMHQSFNGSFQAPTAYAYNTLTYEQQQQLLLAQLQQQRAATMMGQTDISQTKQTESKPRLAKDEVDTLEREFQKNPKPNSSLKRDLADQMRVDVARINNWFQNRRAKAKQIKKTQEFEAQQAAERVTSESRSPEEDGEGGISEYFGNCDQSEPLQPSSAAFEDSSPAPDTPPDSFSQTQGPAQSTASQRDIAESHGGALEDTDTPRLHQEEYSFNSNHFHGTMPQDVSFGAIGESFTGSHIPNGFESGVSCANEFNGLADGASLGESPVEQFESQQRTPDLDAFSHFAGTSVVDQLNTAIHTFPQFTPESLVSEQQNIEDAFNEPSPEEPVKDEQMSPTSATHSPPVPNDFRLKSPPPRLDIATRRKIPRPAQLNPNAFRSYSYGPKTGLDIPKRSDVPSPGIRRIASATMPMNGRIQKPMLASAPRSPMFSERTKDAFLRSLQGALSPVTPNDSVGGNFQTVRETTVSSSASDEDQRYTFGAGQNAYFQVDPSHMKTPPGTPGVHGRYPLNALETPWNFVPGDEPLVTPGLGSFGSELDFPIAPPAPGYVASQPTTPGFPPSIGPTYYPMFNGSTSLEYKFPDSYMPESSTRSSPIQAQSRHFQFTQNVTPQDFNHDR